MRRLDGKPRSYPSKIKIHDMTVKQFAELVGRPYKLVYTDMQRGYCRLYDNRSKNHPLYKRWISMKQRCYNENNDKYQDYGGRGIRICGRWLHHKHGFWNFVKDMGECPKGFSIDRIDNDKGYSPDNCRWVNQKNQNRNKRVNHILEYNGKKECIAYWADKLNIRQNTILTRLRRGWTVEEALTGERNSIR